MWSSTLCAALLQLVLASCERSDRPESGDVRGAVKEAGEAIEHAGERVKEEAAEARAKGERELNRGDDDVKADELGNTKAEFVATARQRLSSLQSELDRLETDARAKGKEIHAELRDEKAKLDAELQRMESASEEAWADGKQRFADMLGKLEKKIEEQRAELQGEV